MFIIDVYKRFLKCKNEIIISFDIDYYSESFLKECLLLEEKYAGLIASKRLNNSEDGRRLIRTEKATM